MTSKLPAVKPKEVIRVLVEHGFFIHHQSGSHVIMRHKEDKMKRIVVPMHSRDMKKGTLYAIINQAGLSVEEFNESL